MERGRYEEDMSKVARKYFNIMIIDVVNADQYHKILRAKVDQLKCGSQNSK
jgi:hypothetical protein